MSAKKLSLGPLPSTSQCPQGGLTVVLEPSLSVSNNAVGSGNGGQRRSYLSAQKRRATFGGSRLSLHSLFSGGSKEKGKLSRSANDLQAGRESRDSGDSDRNSLHTPPPLSKTPSSSLDKKKIKECPLCTVQLPAHLFPILSTCHHSSCHVCFIQYLQTEILESRVMISCPECSEMLHPNDIYAILADNPALIHKYEEFSLRRVLMADPDTRWCPAPDCSYAVIASGCAACPELRCERVGCGALFCYHCKMGWHPSQTCDEARAQRGSFATSPLHIDSSIRPGDIKACPRCRTYIVKMNDGSCNHMICAICGAEFCWLCLKEISDLHYLSPSGCTFWGKKPWSKKKKLMWQLGTLIGAPVGITLIAGLAVPAIIFGVPVFVGRKVYQRMKDKPGEARRRMAVAGSVAGSFLISPVLATMAVGVGVPIMLAYVYGVVPLSLCRNGNCGVSASSSGVRLDVDEEMVAGGGGETSQEKTHLLKSSGERLHDGSTVTGMSIHSGSSVGIHHRLHLQADMCGIGRRRPSMESGAMSLGERINYEEASTKAMAGSTYCDDKSVHTLGSLQEGGSYNEDQASTRALAGSVVETRSVCGATSTGGDSLSVRGGSIGPQDSVSGRHHFVTVETYHHHSSAKSDRGSPAPLLEEDGSCEISDGEGATGYSHYAHYNTPASTSRVVPVSHHSCLSEESEETVGELDAWRNEQSRTSRLHLPSPGVQSLPSSTRTSLSGRAEEIPVRQKNLRGHKATRRSMDSVSTHSHHYHDQGDDGEFLLLSADTFHQLNPQRRTPKISRSVSLLWETSPEDLWSLISDAPVEPWAVLERIRTRTVPRRLSHNKRPIAKSAGSYTSLAEVEEGRSGDASLRLPLFSKPSK